MVAYEDGTTRNIVDDPYLKGYSECLFVSDGCSGCRLANTPRVGDLTVGELFEADRILPDTDVRDGVSTILVNNDKGGSMFDGIQKDASYVRRIPLSFSKRFNNYDKKRDSPEKKRFFHLLDKGMPMSKALLYSVERRYDVAITGFWRVYNYGGVLTYYALYNLMEDMGLEPIMVDSRHTIKGRLPNPRLYKTGYPTYSRDFWFATKDAQRKDLNPRIRNFVVGSDQVWNRDLIKQESLEAYALDFVEPWRNRVSIAASFGKGKFAGSDEDKDRFATLLKRFNHVSVREDAGAKLCRSMGVKARTLLDPVMLCDPRHFLELAEKGDAEPEGEYVFNYMIVPARFEGMGEVYDELGIEPVTIPGAAAVGAEKLGVPLTDPGCVENWMRYFQGCSFVFTDSFHATVFSILFRKPFVTIASETKEGGGRVGTILNALGLQDRMFESVGKVLESGVLKEPIDFDSAHEKLETLRSDCLEWIDKAMIR